MSKELIKAHIYISKKKDVRNGKFSQIFIKQEITRIALFKY